VGGGGVAVAVDFVAGGIEQGRGRNCRALRCVTRRRSAPRAHSRLSPAVGPFNPEAGGVARIPAAGSGERQQTASPHLGRRQHHLNNRANLGGNTHLNNRAQFGAATQTSKTAPISADTNIQ